VKKYLSGFAVTALALAVVGCGRDKPSAPKKVAEPAVAESEAEQNVVITSPGKVVGDTKRGRGPVDAVVNDLVEKSITDHAYHGDFSTFSDFKITDEKKDKGKLTLTVSYNRTFEKALYDYEQALLKEKKSVLPIIQLNERYGDVAEAGKPIPQESKVVIVESDGKWGLADEPFIDLSAPKKEKETDKATKADK